ncbi:MAG: hypothetical protein ACREXU_11770 [Gammaproteobacteria bacterium]
MEIVVMLKSAQGAGLAFVTGTSQMRCRHTRTGDQSPARVGF